MNRKDFIRNFTYSGLAGIIGGSLFVSGCSREENLENFHALHRVGRTGGEAPAKTKIIVTDSYRYVEDTKIMKGFKCDRVLECDVSHVITGLERRSLLDNVLWFEKYKGDHRDLTYAIDPATKRLRTYGVKHINKTIRFPVFDSPTGRQGRTSGMSRQSPVLMTSDFADSFFKTSNFKLFDNAKL